MGPEEIEAEYESTGRLPNRFIFNGGIIFISNLPKNKMDSAVLSRSFAIDITLRAADVIKRIRTIVLKKGGFNVPGADKALQLEVVDYMEGIATKIRKEVNMRTFISALKFRTSGITNWQAMIERYA
jgi:hypothetical protein